METDSQSQLIDPRNARTKEYKQTLAEVAQSQECPLCPPMRWHPNPILVDDGRWLITKTSQAYENASHHFLLVCKRHAVDFSELVSTDLESIRDLIGWARAEFDIKGGGFTMRFGDTRYSGATLKHLHGHFIVPTVNETEVKPVYFPIG